MLKATDGIKTREDTIRQIAFAMENMYHKCETYKKYDFAEAYFRKLEQEKTYIQECIDTIAQIGNGTEQRKLYESMCHLYDTYEEMYLCTKVQRDDVEKLKQNNETILKFKKSNQNAIHFIQKVPDTEHNLLLEQNCFIKQETKEYQQNLVNDSSIHEQMQHYHNYMFRVKELLQNALEKIEQMEEPYKIATKKIHTLTGKLYDAFYRELNTAKINHLAMIKNNLERREKELLTFETWSEEDKQQILTQIARLAEANKRFYEIVQKHTNVINKRAESVAKQSIIKSSNTQNNPNDNKNNFDINYAEIYFKIHPTQRFKMRPIIPISIEHVNFIEKMQENNIDFKSGLVEIFQGKDAKICYMYERKQKPKIEAVLRESVEHLYKTYEKAIKGRIEELKMHCEDIRDASLAEELGTINDIIKAKKKIQTLLEHHTDFLYQEKGLMDIL